MKSAIEICAEVNVEKVNFEALGEDVYITFNIEDLHLNCDALKLIIEKLQKQNDSEIGTKKEVKA